MWFTQEKTADEEMSPEMPASNQQFTYLININDSLGHCFPSDNCLVAPQNLLGRVDSVGIENCENSEGCFSAQHGERRIKLVTNLLSWIHDVDKSNFSLSN